MLNQDIFVTITDTEDFYGNKAFKVGSPLILRKDLDQEEVIGVYSPFLGQVGNVARTPKDMVEGTKSSARIYDTIMEECACIVRFVTQEAPIAQVYPFKGLDISIDIQIRDYDDLLLEEDEDDLDLYYDEGYDDSDWEDWN